MGIIRFVIFFTIALIVAGIFYGIVAPIFVGVGTGLFALFGL